MIKEYFKKNKQHFLPSVTDWESPQDQWRHERNVSKLNFDQWFFCHPSAYKLMHYGIPTMGMTFFYTSTIILYVIEAWFFMYLLAFMTLTQLYLLLKRLKTRKYTNTTKMTFYDLWMREYPEEDNYI